MYLLTWCLVSGLQTARYRSAETATTVNIVALSSIPFKGCQKNGYILSNQGGSFKWYTQTLSSNSSVIKKISTIARLIKVFKAYYNLIWILWNRKTYWLKLLWRRIDDFCYSYHIRRTLKFLFPEHNLSIKIAIILQISPTMPTTKIKTPSSQYPERSLKSSYSFKHS